MKELMNIFLMVAMFCDEVMALVTLPNVSPVRQGTLAMEFPDCEWSAFEEVEGEAIVDNGGGWQDYHLINLRITLVENQDLRIPMELLLGLVLTAGKTMDDFLELPDGSAWTPDAPRVVIKKGWQIKVEDTKVSLQLV